MLPRQLNAAEQGLLKKKETQDFELNKSYI